MNQDTINSLFNLGGAVAMLTSVYQVIRDRDVKGIQPWMFVFFMFWGFWNLYFYLYLRLFESFLSGVFLSTTEILYFGLLLYYKDGTKSQKSKT